MRYTSFYTIKELDYKTIEKNMAAENISPELKKSIQLLIDDHKAVVECKKKLIKEQTLHAQGLFQLFEDSIAQQGPDDSSLDQNKNEDDSSFSDPNEKLSRKKRKKGGKKKLPLGKIINHSLNSEEKTCPCCDKKMHKQKEKTKTYVLSLPMLSTETHVSESYRCLGCETQSTAKNPIQDECIGRYHFSAVSSIAALRYQCGMASYRLENMSDAFGIKVSDSTQWYLFENAASIVRPFVCFLEKEIANAPLQHVDDTKNMILEMVKDIEAEQEYALSQGKDPKKVRSGIHTTNVTGVFPEGEIVLYKTGLHHSGEIIARLLANRSIEEEIIIMADAASANTSKINLKENEHIKMANCNSHVVRKFADEADKEEEVARKHKIKNHQTPEYLNYFLIRYKTIFENEQKAKKMSPKERLLFHHTNSLPLMNEMKIKSESEIAQKNFEPNSEIGKIYSYFLNHYIKFCAFCHFEGAPVCNNVAERMLKSIILHRKNSLFFKTEIGAVVADILTTILFTAKANDINSVDYLRNLLLYQTLWKENPKEWLPWNYHKTIEKIQNPSL